MTGKDECMENDISAGVMDIFDDGRDWNAWIVWVMNGRRRISEGVFELPPARPQIVAVSVKSKKKASRRKKRVIVEVSA